MSASNKGEWAVVVRAKTGGAFFVDGAQHVDEKTARVAFGLAIRSGELDIPVEGEQINAVRLLQWDGQTVNTDAIPGSWRVVQEHECGAMQRWREGKSLPYREDSFHPGVPCMGGAWGSPVSCAMHWGLPLDEEHSVCAEGKRGAKFLGLVLIPKRLQDKFDFRSTMTRDEIVLLKAAAVTELVRRDKADHIGDEELNATLDVFEREIAKLERQKTMTNFEGDNGHGSREKG